MDAVCVGIPHFFSFFRETYCNLRMRRYNEIKSWQSRELRVKCPEDGELSPERKKEPFCRAGLASRCRILEFLLYVATNAI